MNPNPFDWRGPQFLLFYALLMGATAGIVWCWRRWAEGGQAGEELAQARELATDPYAIAFLRGGRYEAVRVAVVALLEQGRLEAEGQCLRTTTAEAPIQASHPLDKAILTRFATPFQTANTDADVVFHDATILA